MYRGRGATMEWAREFFFTQPTAVSQKACVLFMPITFPVVFILGSFLDSLGAKSFSPEILF
jgi:hypothetical protein